MTIPKLGFGTAPILGRLDKKQSLAAISQAYELGVRHFDTARSYGWGEAETVLGSFLSRYPRESYTLVSKCGIVPVKRSPALSILKGAARRVLGLIPSSRALVRRVASSPQFQPARTYDVGALRQSVESSLRELKTSYLDTLLLHNFDPNQDGLPEVVAFFRQLQTAGAIKRFGFSVEGDLNLSLAHLERCGALEGSVVQVPVSEQLLSLPSRWREHTFIAHSPFRFLSSESHVNGGGLSQVLRALSDQVNCEALVTSMFSLEHIRSNLRAHAEVVASRGVA